MTLFLTFAEYLQDPELVQCDPAFVRITDDFLLRVAEAVVEVNEAAAADPEVDGVLFEGALGVNLGVF